MAKLGDATSQYLSTLIKAGADLPVNLYHIQIEAPVGASDDFQNIATSLTVRNSSLRLPSFTQKMQIVNYMTTSVDIPAAAIEGTKEIELSFRLDAHYDVYRFLKTWQSYTANGGLPYAMTSVPGEANGVIEDPFKVSVYAISDAVSSPDQEAPGENGTLDSANSKLLYRFNYCWIKKLSELKFSYDNATPMTVTATIGFYEVLTDPVSLAAEDALAEA